MLELLSSGFNTFAFLCTLLVSQPQCVTACVTRSTYIRACWGCRPVAASVTCWRSCLRPPAAASEGHRCPGSWHRGSETQEQGYSSCNSFYVSFKATRGEIVTCRVFNRVKRSCSPLWSENRRLPEQQTPSGSCWWTESDHRWCWRHREKENQRQSLSPMPRQVQFSVLTTIRR